MAATSVDATMESINHDLRAQGGAYAGYSCKTISWDDVQRGTVGGSLSCWGGNITDTRLWERNGARLFTVRSDNWNEKLGCVTADEVCIISGNQTADGTLSPVTLGDFLKRAGAHGAYVGLPANVDLSEKAMDAKVSIRFQTTFLPVADEQHAALEFCPEMYNYQTLSDADPKNLLLLATTQGVALQADGAGAKRLFHHAVDPTGQVCRYWFEAERSEKQVGGAQHETREEALAAAKRGKATAAVIGTRSMGTRFNVLMTVQIPLKQKAPAPRLLCASAAVKKKKGGGMSLLGGMGFLGAAAKGGVMLDALSDVQDLTSEYNQYQDACAEEEGCFDEGDSDEDWAIQTRISSAPTLCAPTLCATESRSRYRDQERSNRPRRGTANAARVSRGTFVDQWKGLEVKQPERDPTSHVTVTVVIYNTVAGGVPSIEDIRAAVDDMEALYASCGWKGRLADAGADFMKAELTVADAATIGAKLTQQPYVPPVGELGLVASGNVFPSASA
eukprot:CAMPEP_0119314778 /NCGR_PEP_ID=MMETSP1333-20130426/34029_1 /TAXON_ID=418940 /ORGANISM="Scyphosphaera apsteinii, Strain RCC1455" /LENGTH=503 /DNA_ID=CAMNT_0007319977 /DNA_START=61 /DNA_END=1572 /DNA_ORIENTATION=+